MIRPALTRRKFVAAALASAVGVYLPSARYAFADDPSAEEPSQQTAAPPPAPASDFNGVTPISMSIPKLGVNASIVGVGQEPDGSMAAPSDPDTVGWYTLGPGMGIGGNPVFAGHVDWAGRYRVFAGLTELKTGDAILIIDAEKSGYEYRVESSFWVKAQGAPVEEIFAQPEHATITLITCGGDYSSSSREYLDRLIVRAVGA